MKSGFVCDTLPFTHNQFSGAELSCAFVAEDVKDSRESVFFVTSKVDHQTGNERVYQLPKSHSKELPVDLHIVWKMIKILRKERPDWMYLYTKRYMVPSVLACMVMKVPVIYSVVDYHCLCKRNILVRKNGDVCTGRRGIWCKIRQVWFRILFRWVKIIWTFTETSANRLIEWGMPPRKVAVQYQFDINAKAVKPSVLRHPNLVFVGSMHPHKGVDVVLRCFALVVKQIPLVTLYVVGAGDGVYMRYLRELCTELGIARQALFLGKFSHENTLRVLKAADVVVVAEQWFSDFGNLVVFEAQRLGTPVVAGNLGAAHEFTPHIVQYDSPGAYAEKIREVMGWSQ